MTKLHTKTQKLTSRRAVAPVIATLLLVAIAVVGGSIIFVFSQGFFSSAQISGSPNIESVEIIGYDASDTDVLRLHDGFCGNGGNAATCTAADFDGVAANGLLAGERVGIYLQNQSAQRVTLNTVQLAGQECVYDPAPAATLGARAAAPVDVAAQCDYLLVSNGETAAASLVVEAIPTMEPGEEVTMLILLDRPLSDGRDAQIKLETANGAIFVGTIVAGQQSG